MRAKTFLVVLVVFGSSNLSAEELLFTCGPVEGVFDNLAEDHETDVVTDVIRFEYRTEKYQTIFKVDEKTFVKEQEEGEVYFCDGTTDLLGGCQTISLYRSGPGWKFIVKVPLSGPVFYMYDTNTKILAGVDSNWTYGRGQEAPPESFRTTVLLTLYSCDLQVK